MKKSTFKMRSPHDTTFKMMGSSPMKKPRRGRRGGKGLKALIAGGAGAYVGSKVGGAVGGSTGQVVGAVAGGLLGLGVGGGFRCTKTSCTGTTGSYR
tara:strand:- start:114 stop:404 length:291 start_codon:yes stop_codon:yes gene_type:complete